jgi:hypothetical protein
MLPKTLIKGFDKDRLKVLLALFFMALAIPTTVLIWQAYSQLKWEAFHQYRGMAEELTNRMDSGLVARINAAEALSFADYTFLVVTGDPSANLVQRSPLSEFPVTQDLPGVIGYFQVGTDGDFSTPLLPKSTAAPVTFGIGEDEYEQRLQLAHRIQEILSDNRLVQHQPTGLRRGLASSPATPKAASDKPEAEEEADAVEDRQRQTAEIAAQISSEAVGDKDAVDRLYAMPEEPAPKQNEGYSQAVFDELNRPRERSDDEYGAGGLAGESMAGTFENKERLNTLGKVADLKLDAAYQKKSEVAEQSQQEEQFRDDEPLLSPGRMKRREQISLPESESVAMTVSARRPVSSLAGPTDLRISTFESEIDPLEFSLLDSGHFVLFRKVWREGERYIQGLLVTSRDS